MGVVPSFSHLSSLPTFTLVSSTPLTTTLASGGLGPTLMGAVAISPDTVTRGPLQTLSLPTKIIKKVLDLEYVDMGELLPDSGHYQEEEQKCCHQRRQRRGPVTDILLWVEGYSSLVSILSSHYPDKTAHFMAYLKTIVKAHRTFTGEAWVTYDSCYRRKAAITRSLDWGVVDFTLYNETFTGRAKAIPRCRYCLSEVHTSNDCLDGPEPQTAATTRQFVRGLNQHGTQICHLFNSRLGNRCNFRQCKFDHVCSDCRGNHPVSTCRRARPPFPKRPHLEYKVKK